MIQNVVKRNPFKYDAHNKSFKFFSLSTLSDSNQIDNEFLNVINKSSQNELITLGVSKARSEQIMLWREKNGPFENSSQLLQLNGFGNKVLQTIMKRVLNPPEPKPDGSDENKEKKKTKTGKQFCIPTISEHQRLRLNSCLALNVGVSNVSWSRFEVRSKGPCLLTDWQYNSIEDKKLHINDLVKFSINLIERIPDADCYVLENPKIAHMAQPGSPPQININVQKSQLIGIISYALSNRRFAKSSAEKTESMTAPPNLFYLKKLLYPRLFDTLIGSESISTTDVISDLIKSSQSEDAVKDVDNDIDALHNIRGRISVPQEFRNQFHSLSGVEREFLGQSILICLTFIRLCLLKCPYSIEKTSPNRNHSKNKELF